MESKFEVNKMSEHKMTGSKIENKKIEKFKREGRQHSTEEDDRILDILDKIEQDNRTLAELERSINTIGLLN